MLTSEQVTLLNSPLDLDDGHSLRVGQTNKAKDKAQWLTYTEEEPVIERLNAVDPNWSSEITNTTARGGEFIVYMRLTVCGVARDGVGTDNSEKAAATDALKRSARLFGVGLYLKRAPRIWTDWDENANWDRKGKWEDEAKAQFARWYRQQFGQPPAAEPAAKPEPDRRIPTGANGKPASEKREGSELDNWLGPKRDSVVDHAPTDEQLKQNRKWMTEDRIHAFVEWARGFWTVDGQDPPALAHVYEQLCKALKLNGKANDFTTFYLLVFNEYGGTAEDAANDVRLYEPSDKSKKRVAKQTA